MTRRLNSQEVLTIIQHIQNHIKDEKFMSLFLEFFEDDYSQRIFTEHERKTFNRYFEKYLIALFGDYTIEIISWEQYCLSMKRIRVRSWDVTKSNELNLILRTARKLLSDLYRYLVENVHLNTIGFNKIKENKEFLIWEERKAIGLGENLFNRLGTNFPPESSIDQLHLDSGGQALDSRKLHLSDPNILNLNISNAEIKNLLLGFYLSRKRKYPLLRQFLYLFRYSLMAVDKEPQSITDFTFEVFKKQYRFYQNQRLKMVFRAFIDTSYTFSRFLVQFYLYLCKSLKEQNIQHNIFEGTLYNENTLGKNNFTVYYERGYKLIPYNPYEEVPIENRWQLIPSDGWANTSKNRPHGIDFLQIKDMTLREDLKHYIWRQSSMSVTSVARNIYTVIEFLCFISSYKQLNELNDYVDVDLMEQWNFYIGSKEISTMNCYVKNCRAYLRFYKDKYDIPQLLIDMLKQKPQDYNGGNPLTKHDVDLFSKKFQEQRSRGITGELCYIIFNLAVTTKLRLGEIFNLERDCIVEKYEQAGVIQYHSKVTGNQKVKATLVIEKINLIEKSIRLTEDAHSKASEDIKQFIFVKEDFQKKDRIIDFIWQFWNSFTKIQKELEGQLNGKYCSYDLRSTFIDNIYSEGINDGLSTSVIAEMAGNSARTALKHYRKRTEAQEYAEMFAGVTVSGVDVYGNISEEKDVEKLNPVEDGLGGCNQKGCVIDDEQYECLICPHFATTANRIPLFKKRITRLKTLKESTLNSQERNLIDAQLKLYTAYYVKLIEKIGGE
ncbi:site-specific integrase [Peribacillus frigoritolerans]|uniref:site-specific integrase n=1 Tax=Peribacillus frigoritolerans TaxID=450367 RepID=UPI002280EDB4|nr:site-specific integrase [Peribacillus frigoritolerans]MCY8938526.1 site-specific integrase [Peribacillus frigoritolerans]